MSASTDESVHPTVRKAAAWAWRLLVLFAAALTVLLIARRLEVIVVPVALALMMSALLLPGVDWLDRRGVPRGLAVFLLLLGGVAVLAGLLSFVVDQFIDGVPGLVEQVTQVVNSTQRWLTDGPLHLSSEQIDSAGDTVINGLRNNQAKLTSGALSTAETITKIFTGAFVVLFTLIFFLYGGRNIWQFVVKFFPSEVRDRVHAAGIAGFESLIGYVRATFLVALVDAVGIGIGLAVMGVPLALPLASLVFLGAFVPLVGAVLTGLLAVLVALIAKGWIYALVTLGLIIAVNQLEAHVLQPLVMGRAVSIHPLAVVLGISTGGILAGIVGALLAVPTIAFIDRAVRVLVGSADTGLSDDGLLEAEPDEVSTAPPDAAAPPH
ncbi:AI-2E family transporter [Mycolicibacter terrae]|uniref:AI-2E family transporter n=1 Tax=Mycolicibacter terrae TaxID=1788 RepID=A0ACD2EKN2_9MYCO|nr:AI-2E family transporter [Mycolicibacter terrae]RRR43117.1 AI-2E family transporter [Mycolicibacter terrae]